MRIEQFSDEHGIHVRASEEAFLMTRDEARNHLLYLRGLQAENAKLQNTIDELRKLVRAMWLYDYAGKFSSAPDDVEHVAMVYQSMRKLGVEL